MDAAAPLVSQAAEDAQPHPATGEHDASVDVMALGLASVLGPVVRDFDARVEGALKSQSLLTSSIDRLTKELDKLLEDTPIPMVAQHAAKLSGVRKRVASLMSTLRVIQGRIANMDRMLNAREASTPPLQRRASASASASASPSPSPPPNISIAGSSQMKDSASASSSLSPPPEGSLAGSSQIKDSASASPSLSPPPEGSLAGSSQIKDSASASPSLSPPPEGSLAGSSQMKDSASASASPSPSPPPEISIAESSQMKDSTSASASEGSVAGPSQTKDSAS